MKKRKKSRPESPAFASFARGDDGTRLYFEQRVGAGGPSVVLCDGLGCDGFIWKYLQAELDEQLGIAHFHYRGHGRSGLPVDPEQLGVDALAADLSAVRGELGDPPVVLVGHSLGTQVVLEAYRRRPQRVVALVLLCGSFGRVTYTFKGSEVLASVLPNLIDFASAHPRVARALWSSVPTRMSIAVARLMGDINLGAVREEDVEPYFEHVSVVDFELFLRMLRAAGEHSAEDVLPEVRVPALVVAGGKDSFTPPAVSEAMAHAIPHAELHVIPDGTHLLPLEHHAELADLIETFLARHRLLEDDAPRDLGV